MNSKTLHKCNRSDARKKEGGSKGRKAETWIRLGEMNQVTKGGSRGQTRKPWKRILSENIFLQAENDMTFSSIMSVVAVLFT